MEHLKKLSQPERFKIAREYINKSQEEVEELINFSRSSISKHETKEQAKPSVKYVLFLEEFGINPQWLLCKSEDMLKEDTIHSSKEMEQIKKELEQVRKEKSFLEKKIQSLERKVEQLVSTIHILSGKSSEHKPAAAPRRNFFRGAVYAPKSVVVD